MRLCNWDRWGADDSAGTLNFVTAEKLVEAAALVRTGRVFELGLPLDRGGPQQGRPRRFNPLHFMTALHDYDVRADGMAIADDVLLLPLQAGTQWDALAHVSYKGLLYGGRSASAVSPGGAATNSIDAVSSRFASRGVLLDLPRHFGLESLEPGYPISVDDLESTLEAAHVELGEGDVLLVRTGFLELCRGRDWVGLHDASPGLGLDTLAWIHERRLAAVSSDTVAVEVRPSLTPGFSLPFHVVALVYMGLTLGELFELEGLARDCAEGGVYEFMLVAPPLRVTGAVGSPINPYAMK